MHQDFGEFSKRGPSTSALLVCSISLWLSHFFVVAMQVAKMTAAAEEKNKMLRFVASGIDMGEALQSSAGCVECEHVSSSGQYVTCSFDNVHQ